MNGYIWLLLIGCSQHIEGMDLLRALTGKGKDSDRPRDHSTSDTSRPLETRAHSTSDLSSSGRVQLSTSSPALCEPRKSGSRLQLAIGLTTRLDYDVLSPRSKEIRRKKIADFGPQLLEYFTPDVVTSDQDWQDKNPLAYRLLEFSKGMATEDIVIGEKPTIAEIKFRLIYLLGIKNFFHAAISHVLLFVQGTQDEQRMQQVFLENFAAAFKKDIDNFEAGGDEDVVIDFGAFMRDLTIPVSRRQANYMLELVRYQVINGMLELTHVVQKNTPETIARMEREIYGAILASLGTLIGLSNEVVAGEVKALRERSCAPQAIPSGISPVQSFSPREGLLGARLSSEVLNKEVQADKVDRIGHNSDIYFRLKPYVVIMNCLEACNEFALTLLLSRDLEAEFNGFDLGNVKDRMTTFSKPL